MVEKSLVTLVVTMLIFSGMGYGVGGYVGDQVIEETETFFEFCNSITEPSWEAQCDEIKENFEKTLKMNNDAKGLYQIVGAILPWVLGILGMLRKL